jgi:hypothetical protein
MCSGRPRENGNSARHGKRETGEHSHLPCMAKTHRVHVQRLKSWFRNHTKTDTRTKTSNVLADMLKPKHRAVRKPQRRQIYQQLYKARLAPLIAEELARTQPLLEDGEDEEPGGLRVRRMAAMQRVVNEHWPKEDQDTLDTVEVEFNKRMEEWKDQDEDEVEGDNRREDDHSVRIGGGYRTPQQLLE